MMNNSVNSPKYRISYNRPSFNRLRRHFHSVILWIEKKNTNFKIETKQKHERKKQKARRRKKY